MKMLLAGLAVFCGALASSASAEVFVTVEGTQYPLSALMENCQSMGDNPAAQIACFNAVSAILEKQSAAPAKEIPNSVPETLEALRSIAQHEDAESGLIINGTGCNVQFLYYANYFHVSRRNVSSIDLFSASIDMSKVSHDQTIKTAGGQTHVSRGTMHSGAVASTIGGVEINSAQYKFPPKSARTTISEYAVEVVNHLKPSQSATFDFVLVHPAKVQSSAEIWNAFEAYSAACQRPQS